jgi:outer membrane protein assembly factor BamB
MHSSILHSRLVAAGTLAALCGPFTAVADAQSWDQYRGDSGRTARIAWPEPQAARSIPQSITSGAVKVWRATIERDAMLDASPVVAADGTIYVGATERLGRSTEPRDETARLFAFSPSGKKLWEAHLDGYFVRTAPAVRSDGRLVVVGQKFPGDADGAVDTNKVQERVFLVDQRNGAILGVSAAREPALRGSPLLAAGSDEPLIFYRGRFHRYLNPFERAGTDLGGMSFDIVGEGPDWGSIWERYWDSCLNPLNWPCEFHSSSSAPAVPPEEGGALAPSPAYSSRCGTYAGGFLDRLILMRLGREKKDSRIVWEKGGIDLIQTPVFGKTGRLYLVTGENGSRLEGYDQSGNRLWRTSSPEDIRFQTPPALGRGSMPSDHRTGASVERFECTRVEPDGRQVYVRDHTTWVDTLYVGGTHRAGLGFLFKFGHDGRLIWRRSVGSHGASPPVVLALPRGQELVVIGSGSVLSAWTRDGKFAWRLRLDGPVYGTPAVANGRIYVTTTSSLYAIEGAREVKALEP